MWSGLRRRLGIRPRPRDGTPRGDGGARGGGPWSDERRHQRGRAWDGDAAGGPEAGGGFVDAEAEHEAAIEAIRVVTGDIAWRYAIVNTIRSYARVAQRPGRAIDPTASTDQAVRLLQEAALDSGGDAVIHTQFHILRYEVPGDRGPLAVYETHAFGTAIRILGPPEASGHPG